MIFAFLNKIREEGPLKYIFDEMKVMGEIGFENKTKPTALMSA